MKTYEDKINAYKELQEIISSSINKHPEEADRMRNKVQELQNDIEFHEEFLRRWEKTYLGLPEAFPDDDQSWYIKTDMLFHELRNEFETLPKANVKIFLSQLKTNFERMLINPYTNHERLKYLLSLIQEAGEFPSLADENTAEVCKNFDELFKVGIECGFWDENKKLILKRKRSPYSSGIKFLGQLSLCLKELGYIPEHTPHEKIGKFFCEYFNIPINQRKDPKHQYREFSNVDNGNYNEIKKVLKRNGMNGIV